MKFTHLIVTKVNIKWLPQSHNEEWLKNRDYLFNHILRPSLKSQTNKNFKFITMWGYDPSEIIDNEFPIILDADASKIDNYKEIGIILYKEMLPKLNELIDEEYVLTTRVDTDNALSYNFVENLHNHIKETETYPFYYDIKRMNMLNLQNRAKSLWEAVNTSAFCSVMERRDDYKCIPYKTEHGRIQDLAKGIKFDDLNALCTIHGENVYMQRELGAKAEFDEKTQYNILI